MARLLKAITNYDPDSNQDGIIIFYRVGGNERQLLLSEADISGLTAEEIRTLAQTRADADLGAEGELFNERSDIIPNPKKEARQWFNDNPGTQAIFDLTLAEIDTEIGDTLDLLFPSGPAGAVGKLRKLWVSSLAIHRVNVNKDYGQ